jgi:hypothetical protein
MGLLIQKSGSTVKRLLQPAAHSFLCSQNICQSVFKGKRRLFVAIDDTLIKKIHSKFMWGAGLFYDTKMGRRIMAYRLVVGIITDGKIAIPIHCAYLFSKELLDAIPEKFETKDDVAISIIQIALKLFPHAKIIVTADGLYSTVKLLAWCRSRNIAFEARMHSNRVVEYKGEKVTVRDLIMIRGLCPKGRQMGRTISVQWHEIDLELTIVRRFDKSGKESIVYQIATYKALPCEHIKHYAKRWRIEMINRTAKQYIGIQECFSRKLETQFNHVAAVLLAYTLAQLDMRINKLDTPEESIRRSKMKKVDSEITRFDRILQAFSQVVA